MSEKEAVISWNAPQPWHPEAEIFVAHALDYIFGGKDWNFTNVDKRQRMHAWSGGSKVIERKRKDTLRLPSQFYRACPA